MKGKIGIRMQAIGMVVLFVHSYAWAGHLKADNHSSQASPQVNNGNTGYYSLGEVKVNGNTWAPGGTATVGTTELHTIDIGLVWTTDSSFGQTYTPNNTMELWVNGVDVLTQSLQIILPNDMPAGQGSQVTGNDSGLYLDLSSFTGLEGPFDAVFKRNGVNLDIYRLALENPVESSSTVPVPSAVMLLGTGLVGLRTVVRRRRKS